MAISLPNSLAVGLWIALVSGICQAGPLPARALVVYQALENAAWSLRVKPDGAADYLVWSSGRVREHRNGHLARAQADDLLARVRALPKLADRPSRPSGRSGAEREVDRFVVLTGEGRIAGSLRQAPPAHGMLLDAVKSLAAALPIQPLAGLYLWADPLEPAAPGSEQEAEPPAFAGAAVERAQEEALAYPYAPVPITGPCRPSSAYPPHPAAGRFRLSWLQGGADAGPCPSRP